MARRTDTKIYDHLYTRFTIAEDGCCCIYCGEPYEHIDHVPAISVVASIGTKALHEAQIPLLRVQSCEECNLSLSGRNLYLLEERLEFLYEKYVKANREIAHWEEEEIDQLGSSLKRYVDLARYRSDELQRKVEFIRNRRALAHIIYDTEDEWQ